MRDPYTILGVSKTADAAEIKAAYRKAAKKHHPDQNPGDAKAQARFAEANQAYEILGDAARRREFDQGLIGPDGKPKFSGGGPGPGAGAAAGGFGGFSGNPFEAMAGFANSDRRRAGGADDILSELFGASFGPSVDRRRASRSFTPPQGNDVNILREITLEEAEAGRVEVELPTGARLAVNLPKGMTDGQVIRLKGKGYSSPTGGQPGDANITIRFRRDQRRKVDGTTVTVEVPLPFETAVLGGKVPVDTPQGRIALTIPPMTDGDRVFRLKDRGLADKDGKRGDLLVSVRLMLPRGVDAEAEALAAKAAGGLRAKN
jgi:DnaJ-class molecular chaperone